MLVHLVVAVSVFLLDGVVSTTTPTTGDKPCAPMDVVFLLDSSQKVYGDDFDKQLEFANTMVDQLDIGSGPSQTRVGVISIGYTYLLQFYLRTHQTKEEVKTAIRQIRHRYSYETNIGSSIRFMTQYMFRPFFGGRRDATRVAIVITDGGSTDAKSTRFEALLARKKGVKIFAIGVGEQNEEELFSIGSKPKDNYVFTVDSFDDLQSVIPNLPRTSCELSSLATRRPAPTKRFTFAPLNFNAFKVLPTKARVQIAAQSSTTSLKTTEATTTEVLTTQGHVSTGIFSSESTTHQQVSETQTTTESIQEETTTSKPSTQAPTSTSPDSSSSTTESPSTQAPTSTAKNPSTESPTTTTTILSTNVPTSTTNAPSTAAPTSTTNAPSTNAQTSSTNVQSTNASTATTDTPSTPEPTTTDSPSTQEPTSAKVITSTPAPTTPGPDPSTMESDVPSTQVPTSTTNIPSTAAPTSRLTDSPTTTDAAPSTGAPTTPNPPTSSSMSSPTSKPLARVSPKVLNQPAELAYKGGLSEMSLSNEPVEINNAPTKPVSEGKYYKYLKKLFKDKKPLERMTVGNDITNVLSGNNGKWAPASRMKTNDAMAENDMRIWSMMMQQPAQRPSRRYNRLSPDVTIADEPKQYCGGKDADVFFALDSSNSIWPEDFRKQIEFVTSLIDTFDFRNNKTRVGIIVYSTDIYMKVSLQSGWTKEQIKRQLNNTEYISGLTNTSDAIRFIRMYGFTQANERENAIKIAIILTDGISRDPISTKRESGLSREAGIKLFAIGIGTDVDKTELKRIANDPDDKYVFHVSSFAALATIRSLVAVSACGVVPDQPSNLLQCGSNSVADVIFVYDAPGLGARKARLLTSFVHDITRQLQTTSGKLRIGRRSDNCPNSNIDLTTDIDLRAFSNIMFPGIETLLGQLRMAFPNRLDAKNLAVLFVDESTQNIELATRVLKGDLNFHVMVIAIGDMSLARVASDLATYPHNDYLMNIPSYMSLNAYRLEFLQKLCYLITNEVMYLRDARARDSGDL